MNKMEAGDDDELNVNEWWVGGVRETQVTQP